MSDVGAVMWKEWRELRAQTNELGKWQSRLVTVFLILFMGGLAALAGPFIVTTPLLLVASYAPILGMLTTTCDSFAGERERHTLETLLASRLRSEALLVGKIATHVVWGCSMAFVLVIVFIAGANIRTPLHPVFPPPAIAIAIIFLTPLVATFYAAAGALVSLRAPTVRHAQSRLVLVFLSFFLIAGVAARAIHTGGLLVAVIGWCLIFAVADFVIVMIAWARFRRDRLLGL